MTPAAHPKDELERLEALRQLMVLDTDAEPVFDSIARCAASYTGSPIALVCLIDEKRQWFKSRVGLQVSETPRDAAFCAHAILNDRPLVVPDVAADERFFDNPLVTGAPFIKSYLGAPVVGPRGHRIGTLCVIDRLPHAWSASDIALVQGLASIASELFEYRSKALLAAKHTHEVIELTEEIARERRRLAHIIDGTAAGTLEWDIRAGSVRFNERMAAMAGYELEELGSDFSVWAGLLQPEDQAFSDRALADCASNGGALDVELRLRHREGHWIWVSCIGGVVSWDGDGAPSVLSCLVTNISARRQAAEQLRESLDELNAYFDLSLDLLCIANLDGRFLRVSKAFETVLGLPIDTLDGAGFLDLIHPEDVDSTREVMARLNKGMAVTNFVNRCRRVDRSFRHLEWHVQARDGKFFAVGRDVSDKIESELRDQRMRAFSDAISEMQVEVMSSGSTFFALSRGLRIVLELLGGQAMFVCELGLDEDEGASATIRARAKTAPTANSQLGDESPEFTLQAEFTLAEVHRHLIGQRARRGLLFDGHTSAQLGAASFTGLPIVVGEDLVGVLAVDAACAKSCMNDPDFLEFSGAVGDLLLVQRDADRRRQSEENAQRLARLDVLTGLGNRRYLAEQFEGRIDHEAAQFALILIDLDRFKPVNDLHGHLVGDEVLHIVAQRLRRVVRGDCALVRLGGDEFAILTEPRCDADGVSEMAQRILDTISEPISAQGLTVSIGASIGIAAYPSDARDLTELLQFADAAMYRAKERRGEVQFFQASMDEGVRRRAEFEAELRTAVMDNDIAPHFQPVVCLRTGAVVGHEVLARWTHAQHGSISPAMFIPVAEKTGLIDDLFWKTLRAAFIAYRRANATTLLSVNLSALQTKDPMFTQRLLQTLLQSGFPPSRLEVEVTETAMIADVERARTMLLSLKNQGVHIALDDFGTGYSSLLLLRDLPIDKIKIDRSFVANLTANDSPDAKIVDAILGMAHAMKLVVTAEGIETEACARLQREKGCQFGQGYLFSKATPEILFEFDDIRRVERARSLGLKMGSQPR